MRCALLRQICFVLWFGMSLGSLVKSVNAEEPVLAQIIASGGANESIRTIILFANPSMSMVEGMGELLRPDGMPLPLRVNDGEPSATFSWSVAPLGTSRVRLTSSNPSVEVGWLKISTVDQTEVSVSAAVQHLEADRVVSQASILSSPQQFASTFIHDSIGPAADTSVSVANPHDMENIITLALFDANGQLLDRTEQILSANSSVFGLVSELFRDVSSIDEMEGLVNITGRLPFVSSALHASGQAMRTVPMTPGALERFGFEDATSQGWLHQTIAGSQVITGCMALAERPFLGRFALRCDVALMCINLVD